MIPILTALLVLLALSSVVLFICHHLRVPTVLGFLVTGILAGPHGLGLVQATQEVEVMAEIGVVLLLFTIGLEFSLGDLWQMRRIALGGGFLQVGLTVLAGFALFALWGHPSGRATFAGFFLALSSSAVVIRLLQERGETDAPHGRAVLGILILQDILVVPMMLLVPVLAGEPARLAGGIGVRLLESGGVVALIVLAKWGVPHMLHLVVRTRDRELFALFVGVICLTVAWLTHVAGLSLALGAFLAGAIIAGSEFSHDALAIVLPFRHVFASIFFVSIGMLLDLDFAAAHAPAILLLAALTIVLKTLVAGGAIKLVGRSVRTALLGGLSLAQIGEFSFLLLQSAAREGLVEGDTYQLLLAAALVTLAATPFTIALAPRLADRMGRLASGKEGRPGPQETLRQTLQDHLIVVGYGVGGRNVARAARACGIPYIVLESNSETVRAMRKGAEPICYGDAVNLPSLEACGVERARVMVVAISDPTATRRVVSVAKRRNPALRVIVRTRYIRELPALQRLGADEVIAEEFETSIEMFTRVLAAYLVPRNDVEGVVEEIRSQGYGMLRSPDAGAFTLKGVELDLPGIEIGSFRVEPGAPGEGKSLAHLDLRRKFQVTALAWKRDETVRANPPPQEVLREKDVVILMGSPEALAGAAQVFTSPKEKDLVDPKDHLDLDPDPA
jgi:CPA2 family monovalent cation:H+ antiporter-2